jgi:hypothetical protein
MLLFTIVSQVSGAWNIVEQHLAPTTFVKSAPNFAVPRTEDVYKG